MNAMANMNDQHEQHQKTTRLSCEEKQINTGTTQNAATWPATLCWRSMGSHKVDIIQHHHRSDSLEWENSVSGELTYTVDAHMPIKDILMKVAAEFKIPKQTVEFPSPEALENIAETRHLAMKRWHLEMQMGFLLHRYCKPAAAGEYRKCDIEKEYENEMPTVHIQK